MMRMIALVAAAFTFAGGTTTARVTSDQPDDIQGPQIHVIYAIPSDGSDRSLDTNGTIAASVANWEGWLRGQTGGHGLRLDTYHGDTDITFFRSTQTEAQNKARGAFLRDELEAELKAAGLVQPNKLYAVYYDGQSTQACGGGAWPPTLPGIVAAIYLPSTYWNSVGAPCYDPQQSLAGMNLMDYAIVHELMHTMGFVPTCAPHFTAAGHVSDSPTDLMYAGPQDWHPSVFDVGHDDYFGAHISGCSDFLDAKWVEGRPQWQLSVHTVGKGTVSSRPDGIACGATCAASFDPDTQVTLRAVPLRGAKFAGWRGACEGTTASCTVAPGTDATVGARFVPKPLPRCRKGQKSTKAKPCRVRAAA